MAGYEYRALWDNEKEGNHVNARSWSNAGWRKSDRKDIAEAIVNIKEHREEFVHVR